MIARSTLAAFWTEQPDAEQPLKAWHEEASAANWRGPQDVKATYGRASVLKHGRVVFDIKGNDYRLVVYIHYRSRTVFIKFVGTHEDYDDIDAQTVGGTGKAG